ncbi:ESPR-type extended signal peptide-containing protein, partial [Sutterella wadsworthensis]|uniref:ESPR-type extended signal peptide-containing protein n=1 Tax=Sutterella wadsworthensis TaxID=40545 RepID=UPI0013F68CC8
MNRNFKVVFSKARGALMVVNEATSSIQAKGTKTVIAAAIAAVAGSAMAASAYVEAPTKAGDDVAIFDATSSVDKLKAENSFVLTATENDTTVPLLSPTDNYTLTADKKIWVTGVGAKAHASGIWMDTADKTATNESTIYVTTGKDGKYYANRAMGVNKGKIVNNGTIVAKNAYGMTVGSTGGDATAEIINGVDGKIIVEDQGVGIELGGSSNDGSNQTKATAQNYGEIYAGKPAQEGNYIAAVQIKGGDKASDDKLLADQIFKNEASGKIYAADATAAIYDNLTTGAKIENLGLIEGDVIVGEKATGTVITLGTTSVLTGDIQVLGTNTKIDLSKDAVTTGDIVNTGTGTTITAATETGKVSTLTGSILAKSGDITQSGNLKAESLVVGVAAGGEGKTAVKASSGAYTVTGTLGVKTVSLVNGSAKVTGDKAALTADEVSVAKDASLVLTEKGAATVGKLTIAKEGAANIAKDSVLTVTGADSVNYSTIGGVTSDEGDTATTSLGTLAVAGTLSNLGTISTDVVVTGTLNNNTVTSTTSPAYGLIDGNSLTVKDGGVVNTKISEGTNALYRVATTTVKKGGTFNVLELNSKSSGATANDQMLFAGATLILDGGSIQVAGTDYKGSVKLGMQNAKDTELQIQSGDYEAKAVTFGGAQTASLTVKGGSYTVGTLDTTNAKAVTVDADGKLVVTDSLKAAAGDQTVVNVAGELSTKLVALGYTIGSDGKLAAVTTGATAAQGSIGLENGGVFYVTDIGAEKLTTAEVNTLKKITTGTSGLVDFGSLAISDLKIDATNNTIKVGDLIAGVTTDTLKQVTVTEVTDAGISAGGSYGALQLAANTTSTKVAEGTTLTLNKAGDLVTYTDATTKKAVAAKVVVQKDAELVTTGEGAKLGAVVKADQATGTAFTVAQGSTEVSDLKNASTDNLLINVGELEIAENASLTAGLTVEAKAAEGTTPAVEAKYGDISVDTLYVVGTLNADQSKVTIQNNGSYVTGAAFIKTLAGSLNVGNDEKTGLLVVDEYTSGTIFADPSWESGVEAAKVAVKKLGENASVQAGRNSIVALGTLNHAEAVQAVADSGFVVADADAEGAAKNAVNSVVYVTGTSTTNTTTGEVIYSQVDGSVLANNAKAPETVSNVKIAKNSLLVLDVANLDKTGEQAVFSKSVTLDNGAKVYLGNIANGQKIKFSDTSFANSNSSNSDTFFFDGDLLMDAHNNGGVVSIGLNDRSDFDTVGLNGAGFGVIYAMYENGENVGNDNAKFFRDLFTKNSSVAYDKLSDGDYELNISKVNTILNDVAAIGATTGAQAVTMDAVNQMADTVAARTSILTQRAQGVNVWVDV